MQERVGAFIGGSRAERASGRQRLRVAEGGRVEATVHVHDLAGDAAGEVGEHEGGCVADLVDGDVAAQQLVPQEFCKRLTLTEENRFNNPEPQPPTQHDSRQ